MLHPHMFVTKYLEIGFSYLNIWTLVLKRFASSEPFPILLNKRLIALSNTLQENV